MMLDSHCLVILFIGYFLACLTQIVSGQNCFGNTIGTIGGPGTDPLDANTVILTATPIGCEGVISAWQYTKSGSGACNDLYFSVWRDNGVDMEIVGWNQHPASYCTPYVGGVNIEFGIAPGNRIPVQSGYYIGIHALSGLPATWTMIAKDNTGTVPFVFGTCTITAPGGTCAPTAGANADISLSVTVIEGPPPHLDNLDTEASVFENEPAPFFTVLATHSINTVNPLDGNPANALEPDPINVEYSVPPGMFSIDPGTGAVSPPAGGLNYEAIPNPHILPITVTAMNRAVTGMLTIHVLDVNEAHTIDNLPTTISVSSTAPKDQVIYTVLNSDPDTNLTTIYYSMLEFSYDSTPTDPNLRPPFKINSLTGEISTSMDVIDWVFQTNPPSAPTDVTCIITVHANDGQFDVTGTLTVTITNIRHPPAFVNLITGTTSVTVEENTVIGGSIYSLASSGPDPPTIRYHIIDVTNAQGWHMFSVDEISGDVNIINNPGLDYFVDNRYTIEIGIKDNLMTGTPQELTVNIGWVNQPPEFEYNTYYVTIPEKCGNVYTLCSTYLATPPPNPLWWPSLNPITPAPVFVTDRDIDSGQAPSAAFPGDSFSSCDILPADGSSFFTFNCLAPSSFEFEVNSEINVNADPQYQSINLTMRAVDEHGGGALSDIYIQVYDINDNIPTFIVPLDYQEEVYENTRGGVSILTVTATDADFGLNAEIRYSIVPSTLAPPVPPSIDPTNYFTMNATSGLLTTRQPINYEAIDPKYVIFDIQAADRGTPQRYSDPNITVNITVLDVNDNRPVWDCSDRPTDLPYNWSAPCFYNLDLRDDINVGFMVQQITATDVDTVSQNITYFLLKQNEYFLLTTLGGDIYVKWPLQTYTEYILYNYAEDNGDPNLLSSIMYVRIDTYTPCWQLVDVTLDIPRSTFNDTVTQQYFIEQVRAYLASQGLPWFAKWERYTGDIDQTTVTIYALEDNSTYELENLGNSKVFVHKDDLLHVLRQNIRGVPRQSFVDALTYTPTLVMPACINWFTDTIEGIITLTFLTLIALALLIFLIVIVLKKYRICCFKEKPKSVKRDWPETETHSNPMTDMSSSVENLRQRGGSARAVTDEHRRASIDTIHSAIIPPSYY